MEKETILKLVGILALILLLSFLLPQVITFLGEYLSSQIMKNAKTEVSYETEESGYIASTLPLEEWEPYPDDDMEVPILPIPEDAMIKNREEKLSYDEGLEHYRMQVQPEYLDQTQTAEELFIADRTVQFNFAIADQLYSLYGEKYQVEQVVFWEQVRDTPEEISYQMEVIVREEDEFYSELFIGSYNKVLDYYSLYGYL